jgi:hypothetical protein
MARRLTTIIGLLLAGLALLAPATASAQGPIQPPQPPASRDDIPDVAGYVSFEIQPPGWLNLDSCEQEPTGGDWWDVGFQVQRLIWLVNELFRQLFCLLLSLIQFLANAIAGAINAAILGFNELWRFLVFAWLQIRSWLYMFVYLWEVFRDWWQQVSEWLIVLWAWVMFLIDALELVFEFLGDLLLLLLDLALGGLGLLAWLGGLVIGLILDLLAALDATTVPTQLSGTHPIYEYTRGMMDGVKDSEIGWMFLLIWGMCYVAFVAWLAHFLGASKETA